MSYRNGNEVDMEFTGRLKISGPKTDAPKLKLYQVWAVSLMVMSIRSTGWLIQIKDSAPIVTAMKGLGK
jgi:hypothetical protein